MIRTARVVALSLLLALVAAPPLAPAAYAEAPAVGVAPTLDPARTWAVVAGVLEWKDPALKAFEKRNRKDAELFEVLGARGVPAARRTLLLDAEATADAVLAAVSTAVKRAGPGETLLIYFGGHGIKLPDGRVVFATSDTSSRDIMKTGLHLDALAKRLTPFKGERILLLADCCHSGGLAGVVTALGERGIQAVSLTSAEAANESTGNWTYTQAVIDAFTGRALADRDGDGAITLGELEAEVRDAMRFREAQRAGFESAGVAAGLVVARARPVSEKLATGEGDYAARAWVRAPHPGKGGRKAVARVHGGRDDQLRVAFYDYSDETLAWVPRSRAEPIRFESFPVGARIDVVWGGRTYEAEVLRVADGFHYITYPGWSSSWDEWVGPTRVVGPHAGSAQTARRARVEWQGRWWDVVVLREDRGRYCVHYLGYDASWDECVGADRIRFD